MLPYLRYIIHHPETSILFTSPFDKKILTNKRLFVTKIGEHLCLIDRHGEKAGEILALGEPEKEKDLYGYGIYVLTEKRCSKKYQKKAECRYPVYYANVYKYRKNKA